MEIILLQKVANLGNIGDRVKVKAGYGRNFLLPQGKATLATADNIAKFEARRAELEKAAGDELSKAQARAAKLEGFKLSLTAKAGGEGKLFGSVGTSDIAEATTQGRLTTIERSEVRLPHGPIRQAGEHVVQLHLHTDVTVDLPVDDRRRRVGRASARLALVAEPESKVAVVGPRRARDKAAVDEIRVPPHSVEAEQAVLGGADARQPRLGHDRRPPRRRRLLSPRSSADLRSHRRAAPARSEPSDAVTLSEWLERKGIAERDRRPRLSRGPGARHAERGQRARLRRCRARALDAAPPDQRRRRDRRERLRSGRPRREPSWSTRPSGACSRSPRAATRRGSRLHAARRTSSARSSIGSTCCTRTRAQLPGVSTGFTQARRNDRRLAEGRPDRHRRPALDGQDDLRHQHRRERRVRPAQGARSASSAWKCRASSSRSA